MLTVKPWEPPGPFPDVHANASGVTACRHPLSSTQPHFPSGFQCLPAALAASHHLLERLLVLHPLHAQVNDLITFDWTGTSATHGVYLMPTADCPQARR